MNKTLKAFIKAMTLATASFAGAFEFHSNSQGQNLAESSYFISYDVYRTYPSFITNGPGAPVYGVTSAGFSGYGVSYEQFLTGNISTIPGDTYAISFTFQVGSPVSTLGSAGMTFGSAQADLGDAFVPVGQPNPGFIFNPVNVYFTAVATSTSTPVSFEVILDSSMGASMSNFSIVAVPEPPAPGIFLCGGCALYFARRLRLRGLFRTRIV